jgi:2-oxoglutarate dehydrogenase E1 component
MNVSIPLDSVGMTDPATTVFNDAYIADVFEAYRRDPASVDESWRQYFRTAERLFGAIDSKATPAPATASVPTTAPIAIDSELGRKVAGAASLMHAVRSYGHLAVRLDPLGDQPPGAAELSAEFHRITEAELNDVPGSALGFPHMPTAADVIARLRFRYSRNLGIEYTHLGDEHERQWFRELLTSEQLTRPLTADEKRALLKRLTQVDGLERFLGRAYVGSKRFSIEGTDTLVPMLDTAIGDFAMAGASEVVLAMAHRGRLNVLTNLLGKPYASLFAEFEGRPADGRDSSTGDVKYHLGYDGEWVSADGESRIRVELVPNPSHLEIVNPVMMGIARARQRREGRFDSSAVVPICVHGDASFSGEGIVPETFNLSALRGYQVGGTLHIIVNNQVGFTTDPVDGRSTHYASDIAKGFEVPVIHVNADDPEACIIATRIGAAYRREFRKDFLIDLVGYRRHGHNEGDEPGYTQPEMYNRVRRHPSVRRAWAERLISEGLVTAEDVQGLDDEYAGRLQTILDETRNQQHSTAGFTHQVSASGAQAHPTAVDADVLRELNHHLLTWPEGFHPHPRLAKQLERRRDSLGDAPTIDWGHAEGLAFASLLRDGVAIRLSGQDAERGTFSHRHAVLHDVESGATYMPLAHVAPDSPGVEIYNSPLSELAVMGFEYGYSVAAHDTLTLWEAQFGDFANVAQPVIDQFLAAGRAKWGQDSALVLLLPHGYEGAGPEHSSARLERFLQLCAEGNMLVAYPTTPAQYFHVLRRQPGLRPRRPLILMQPKWMLRLPAAMSSLNDLTRGTFRPVIDDTRAGLERDQVRRLICCSGKIYWELMAHNPGPEVAVVRIEELYPWPRPEFERIVGSYSRIEQVAWVQEEPKNQGAWSYVAPILRVSAGTALELRYVGRPERASPAEGAKELHDAEQMRILDAALALSSKAAPRRRSVVAQ